MFDTNHPCSNLLYAALHEEVVVAAAAAPSTVVAPPGKHCASLADYMLQSQAVIERLSLSKVCECLVYTLI